MHIVAVILRALGYFAVVYSFLCVARIFLSWFPGQRPGSGFLVAVTEPWLAPFRRIKLFRGGGMDFSPVAALAVLAAISRIFLLSSYRLLTIGSFLYILVEVILEPIFFILVFFAVLVLARIVAYLFRWNSLHPIWRAVDALVNPIVFQLKRLVYRNRIVNYMQGLITAFLILVAIRFLLGWLSSFLFRFLAGF